MNRIRYAFLGFALLQLSACAGLAYNLFETTEFQVQGEQLMMNGIINSKTPGQLAAILESNKSLQEIVLLDVPGSVDDEANLEAARMVRAAGLNTRLLSSSEIASGGTDFFLAGAERHIANGARLGVHSWADGAKEGKDFPRSDPSHQLYLDYYREMGIPSSFYWFTLESAPADDIHWMSASELAQYNMATGSR
ncbi:MAG: alpha/beta hydrolase [Pseudomonadota bacterium]